MSLHRSAAQRARDRKIVAERYLQGWYQADIAGELGLTQQTVSNDLKAIQKEWVKSTLVDFDQKKGVEVAKIDKLEREYYKAWDESKGEKTSVSKKEAQLVKGPTSETSVKKEELFGDPRFLQGVQWCINKRCEIYGINAPQKHALTDSDGKDLKAMQKVDEMLGALTVDDLRKVAWGKN